MGPGSMLVQWRVHGAGTSPACHPLPVPSTAAPAAPAHIPSAAAKQDGSEARDLRVPFVRPVEDEREARSALTMMAQVAWEAQR